MVLPTPGGLTGPRHHFLIAVFTISLIAVGAGPGRTRRPALTALILVSGVVLLTALSWSS
ncbi:hypothetical protein SHJG_1635 [Streptomyces hygroscopicus subsp. jinggangensis 5008]|nr:hypothetical protein SHJG_1635 [Streptomyces hygroscopicus subsp. jinggangensis 5008]